MPDNADKLTNERGKLRKEALKLRVQARHCQDVRNVSLPLAVGAHSRKPIRPSAQLATLPARNRGRSRQTRKGSMTRRFPNPWLAPTCTGRRTYAREEKVMVPSSPPNPKSANLEVHTSTTARSVSTLEGGKITILMRIWPTASAHLRVDTLRRKDTQIEEHIRGDNGPGYSLRARRAECSTRATLANITGPSSDRSSVSSGFRYASYANPGEFRISEISQRGSQPSVAPVALRSLPLRPYLYGWEPRSRSRTSARGVASAPRRESGEVARVRVPSCKDLPASGVRW
jgi:hypothetical protein